MCKFESSQKYESRWQSTDSSKAYRNTSAFKYLRDSSHCLFCNSKESHFLFFYQWGSGLLVRSHATAQASGQDVLEKSYNNIRT